MMRRFCAYLEKVFDFSRHVSGLMDARQRPRITTAAVWLSGFLMAVTRAGSLNAIAGVLRVPRRLESLVGSRKPSADTIARVFACMDAAVLRGMLRAVNQQLKRNKLLPLRWPLRFAALDEHEFFPSRKRCCPQCCQRRITVNGEEVIEYYHAGVVCYLVGYEIPIPLDVELIGPGEVETAAAQRLLLRVLENYPRFFDAIVADAAYLQIPFLRFCLKHRLDVVAVLKKNQLGLLTDATALLGIVSPRTWDRGNVAVQAWDMEGFTLANVPAPLRVLHTRECITKRQYHNGSRQVRKESRQWYWATTISPTRLPVEALWEAAHARWEIENDLFHNMSTHWSLDHCYAHEPTAILNFILTLFLAFLLVQTFYHRNLKPSLRARFTVIGLTDELRIGLGTLGPACVWAITLSLPGP